MGFALAPEDGSKLLFVFVKEAWVVKHLLEELGFGIELVEKLQLSSWKSCFHGVRASWVVEGLERLTFENVGEHLALLISYEVDELGSDALGVLFFSHFIN